MKNYKVIILIAAAIVIAFLLTINVYYNSNTPTYDGQLTFRGIADTVEVYTDEYGMPYIFSKNNEDLFFTIGYTMAKERLFQLSLIKAIVNGNIADILGGDYLEHDRYIKSSRPNYDLYLIEDDYHSQLESFCSGINSYIENIPSGQHISFKLTNSQPSKWSVSDVFATLDLMTNNHLADLSSQTTQKTISKYFGESHSFGLEIDTTQLNHNLTIDELILEYEIMDLIGASGSQIGAEGYVVPAQITADNKLIFIFNDNNGYSLPTKWFNLYANGGDYNVSGSTIIGFPLPLVGSNKTAVFASLGNIDEKKINSIFEVAKSRTTNIATPLFVVDTIGSYSGSNITPLYLYTDSLNNLEVGDVLKEFHLNDNSRKSSLLNYINSNYVDFNKYPELSVLANWIGDESSTSKTALLVNMLFKNLVEAIFKDELGLIDDNLFKLFLLNTKLTNHALENVIRNPESSWIDDINTINYTEATAEIVNKAIENSLTEIMSKYGNKKYQWGKVNPPSFKHILANKRISNVFADFDTKSIPRKNSNEGRIVQEFIYDEDFTPTSTAVMTKMFDLSDPNVIYSRLAPGQSGNPASPHYSDQIDLYINESLRKINTSEDVIRTNDSFKHLILYPAG